MAPATPTLNLEDLVAWSKENTSNLNYVHTWGFYRKDMPSANGGYWLIADERCLGGVRIKMSKESPPEARPGDIVRIHRLIFDQNIKEFRVTHPRNVVVWPAFKHKPQHRSMAANPTIEPADIDRRRQLEVLFLKTLYKVQEARNQGAKLLDFAGKLTSKELDQFGHLKLNYQDPTGEFSLRVYQKTKPTDTERHFQIAQELNVGEVFVVTGARLHHSRTFVELSANLNDGRSISFAEPGSIVETSLNEQLPRAAGPVPSQPLRRSPRFNQNSQQSSQGSAREHNGQLQVPSADSSQEEEMPALDRLDELEARLRAKNGYQFVNLAGQIRGKPTEDRRYGNWVFQFYDGSRHNMNSIYTDEIEKPLENCVTILVYKPSEVSSADFETDKHIKTVQQLKEGDLISIRNLKVQCVGGRFKFEMASSTRNGKSIDLIKRNTKFGMEIENRVTNFMEDDDELIDSQAPSTSDEPPEDQ